MRRRSNLGTLLPAPARHHDNVGWPAVLKKAQLRDVAYRAAAGAAGAEGTEGRLHAAAASASAATPPSLLTP